MPMGRDQNDNAARVAARGAGLRLSPKASVWRIRKTITKILQSPHYGARAQELGRRILEDARNSSTVRILEDVAAIQAVQ